MSALTLRGPAGAELRRALGAVLAMLVAMLLAWRLTPTVSMSAQHAPFNLESSIPKEFGEWRMEPVATGIVNPQQEALLNKLYSQILNRTYVNRSGGRVMLSIAYGNDQRDGMQLHYPEVCYPAQGFQLKNNQADVFHLAGREIPGRRLETWLGRQRPEPVTYWTLIGDTAVRGGLAKKIVEVRYGMQGLVPDGLLFRVSSIDTDSAAAFELHQRFSQALLTSVPDRLKVRLAGSSSQL